MSMGARDLRPLSIGEMLDRAFSICFKYLVPFLSLVSVVLIPQLVLSYFGSRDILSAMSDSISAVQNASRGAAAGALDAQRILQAEENGAPFIFGTAIISLLFIPLANAAIVSGVSRAYLGMPVRFADCYADAWRRWPTLLGLTLIWVASVVVASIAVILGFIIVGAALGAMAGLLGTAGIVFSVVAGIVLGLGALLFVFQLYLAAAYSFVAAVLEHIGPIAAFVSGFQRVFGEDQFWRSLAIAASIFGIIIGVHMVSGIVGWAAIILGHAIAIDFVASGVATAFSYPFLFAVVAVSYYDVRIRREGFDLQMLAAQLGAAQPPAR